MEKRPAESEPEESPAPKRRMAVVGTRFNRGNTLTTLLLGFMTVGMMELMAAEGAFDGDDRWWAADNANSAMIMANAVDHPDVLEWLLSNVGPWHTGAISSAFGEAVRKAVAGDLRSFYLLCARYRINEMIPQAIGRAVHAPQTVIDHLLAGVPPPAPDAIWAALRICCAPSYPHVVPTETLAKLIPLVDWTHNNAGGVLHDATSTRDGSIVALELVLSMLPAETIDHLFGLFIKGIYVIDISAPYIAAFYRHGISPKHPAIVSRTEHWAGEYRKSRCSTDVLLAFVFKMRQYGVNVDHVVHRCRPSSQVVVRYKEQMAAADAPRNAVVEAAARALPPELSAICGDFVMPLE